jgi:hypothetical protein
VAPMASGVTHTYEDWFVFLARFGERFVAPRVPVDWVFSMLKEVWTSFVCEAVRHKDSLSDAFVGGRFLCVAVIEPRYNGGTGRPKEVARARYT